MHVNPNDLLFPISGLNPSGENLRYSLVYEEIEQARREEPELPQGIWQRERKKADWQRVIILASDALAAKSKDLQLAAWLTEAMLRSEGLAGLCAGINLIKGLIDNFWDTLYPAMEEQDAEMRAAPLECVATRLDQPIKRIPLTGNGLDWFRYKESCAVPRESEASVDSNKQKARAMAKEGRLTPEEFERAFNQTPTVFYVRLVEDFDASLAAVDAMDALCQEKFGDLAPHFNFLRSVLEEVRQVGRIFLQKKRGLEPAATVEPAARVEADAQGWDTGSASAGVASLAAVAPPEPAPSILFKPSSTADRVHFTLTAPHVVAPGAAIELLVWVHLATQRDQVLKRARDELGLHRNLLARTKGPVRVASGSMLTICVKVPGILIEDPEDVVLWDGEIGCAGFVGIVPKECHNASFPGVAVIYCSGIQIAKLQFVLTAGATQTDGVIEVKETKHQKAFASYAHSDRDEVLARLQGIQKAAPDLEIFLDVLSLRSRQDWEATLRTVIPANDIFYLFWSVNASRSKWVEKEWRCALGEKGLSFIDPVPLQSPEEAPPPAELASLHFYDWMLAFMRRRRQAADTLSL